MPLWGYVFPNICKRRSTKFGAIWIFRRLLQGDLKKIDKKRIILQWIKRFHDGRVNLKIGEFVFDCRIRGGFVDAIKVSEPFV